MIGDEISGPPKSIPRQILNIVKVPFQAIRALLKKAHMGGTINMKLMLLLFFGRRVLREFGGNWGGKGVKNIKNTDFHKCSMSKRYF